VAPHETETSVVPPTRREVVTIPDTMFAVAAPVRESGPDAVVNAAASVKYETPAE
jgi:hypothetical protein